MLHCANLSLLPVEVSLQIVTEYFLTLKYTKEGSLVFTQNKEQKRGAVSVCPTLDHHSNLCHLAHT